MKTTNIVILVLVIVAVVLGVIYLMMRSSYPTAGSAIGMDQTNTLPAGNSQTTTPPANPSGSSQSQPAAAAVAIQNFSFQPTPLTVSVGTTVTWTNKDSVNHQIKSASFNSSPLSQGQTYSFTFQTAGTYDYSCAIHPTMHGQIIVQ